jgi:ATP-dependent DNA helicase RecQ
VKIIEVNPDRRNSVFNVFQRPNKGNEKLYDILCPLVEELRNQKVAAPKTLIYGSMEIIAECYSFFDRHLRNHQYYPTGAKQCAANRIFTQYHANYPPHEQARILKEVVQTNSIIRILFVTVAFGMGIDCPDIRRFIHIGLPRTMEEYFQEGSRQSWTRWKPCNIYDLFIYYLQIYLKHARRVYQIIGHIVPYKIRLPNSHPPPPNTYLQQKYIKKK